ncbi:class I SAM-dependent methyltransferase [Baekduia alba]|uniref:class I SAM-dependent methyltransferase n=1 Tax=Baekduia alba TaxID=2997333 RepID=UPI00233FA32A|nr:class I SAM-dependent methyltransferase [Baekduia alba]
MTGEVDALGAYEAMAAAHVADEDNAYNSLYERPAMVRLLGDVAGRRALDAGCGAGALAAELVARGACVTGLDLSPRMVEAARARGLERATFAVGDLEGGGALDAFGDGVFDLVAASLMVHYLRDWEPVLRAFARVLVPGGRIVLSTHHPAMTDREWPDGDRDAVELLHDTWDKRGGSYDVRFYRRPLWRMEAAFAAAGLVVEALVEPAPLPACREANPVAWERLTTRPWFLFAVLSAPGGSSASPPRG